MTQPQPRSIPVPKLLWDELESALMIKSKELIRDIAKTLRQDESKLLQEFRSKKTSLHLLELDREEEQDYECQALLTSTPIAHRCRKPVAYGKAYCPCHEFFTMPHELASKPRVQRLQGEEPLFVDRLTRQVFTVDQQRVGYLEKSKCIVFEVEEG